MITSSTDIYRSLVGDVLVSAVAKVRIIEGSPSLIPEDGVVVYISKYPQTTEFEASWSIWIIDFDSEPLDLIVSQIRHNFPGFQILEDGPVIRGVLTEVRTTRTDIAPPPPQKISVEPYLETLNEKFEELRESIEDRMLLVNSGRPGKDGQDGRPGRDGRNGRDGRDLEATEVELGDLQDVYVEDAKKDQVLTYDGDTWVARYAEQRYGGNGGLTSTEVNLLQGMRETGEPMGFVDRLDSTISFDDSTRTLTITPIAEEFIVWVKARRFIIDQAVSVQIPDTTGLYFIFFDTEGNIGYQTDYFYWDSEAPAAYVYWDSDLNTAPYVADERHGIVLDWQTHEYLHRTRGTAFANGFNILNYTLNGDGALDSSAQFDLTGGTFFDEDLEINISHSETPNAALFQQDLQGPAKLNIFYKIGSTWKLDAATNFAVKKAVTRPYYNSKSGNSFGLTEVSNNRFINYYIVATHNLRAPIAAIMGQAQHVNITDAQSEDFDSLNLSGFPSKEFRFLYKIIFHTGNFANQISSNIANIQDLRNYSGQFVAALDIGSIRIDQLDAPNTTVNFNNQILSNLGAPVNIGDAVTKGYVDNRFEAFRDSRRIYVSKTGNDGNNGTSPHEALLTLAEAASRAEPGDVVFLGPGTYLETALPIRWKRDTAVFGSGLRNTTVGPAPGYEYNDIFKVDSGFWCWGISFAGHQADNSIGYQSWAVSFNELADNTDIGAVGLGAFILKSPYIQNCTSITAETDTGTAGSVSTGDTGGGINVDGTQCAINSPIRSMVVDSYTQVNLGGPGCLVQNDGYAQLVSFFGTFCTYHVKAETGGQINLSGGGTTDFGTYGLIADGYSTSPLYTGKARVNYFGASRIDKSVTIDVATAIFTSNSHGLAINDEIKFQVTNGSLPTGISAGNTYYVISNNFATNTFKVSSTVNGSSVSLSGTATGNYRIQRIGSTEIDVIEPSPNRLGRQIKYPSTGSAGSPGNPVSINNVNGNQFTVNLDTSTIKHEYVGGGTVTYNGINYSITSATYNNSTGVTVLTANGFIPVNGTSVTLNGLSFICDSASRPNAGQLMFPRLIFPRNATTKQPEAKTYVYTKVGTYTLTFQEASSPSGPEHEYVTGGTVVINSIDYGVENASYNINTGLVTITTKVAIPANSGNVTVSNLGFICPSSAYVITSSIPIDIAGSEVANDDPTRAGYRIIFYNETNGGLINSVLENQTLEFRNRSQISAPGHTFEFVGSGTNYNALPWNGGIPVPANAIIETNNGRVYSSNTNEKGDFKVGSQFSVDGTTGAVTINTDQFNLSGLNYVGPFSRNGGFTTVGVQLQEVSNNTALIASTGTADGNTTPTQFAVKEYVGSRYLTDLSTTAGHPISVSGSASQDGSGNWSYIKNISLSMNAPDGLARLNASSVLYDAQLPVTGVSAGTYRSVTVDTKGRITAGTNPTTFSGYGISDSSANLRNAISDETGTGALVFADSPLLTGVPAAPTATVNTNTTQIATTAFVQTVAQTFTQSLSIKASCRVATVTNITLSGTQSIDGITVAINDRVLVKNQTTASQNGIYIVKSGDWIRSTDFDENADIQSGAFTFIEEGPINADSGWVLTTQAPITLGATALAFVQFSGAGQVIAGGGLTKTGNQIDVVTANSNRIVINSDSIDLATTGVSASTYKSVTVDMYGRITNGTNPTTLSGYGIVDAANLVHSHGNITNDGAIGSAANLPIITTTNGVLTTGQFGSSANTFCQGNDSRLSDARTPVSHSHGNITNVGAIGSTSGIPIITGTDGVLQAGAFGSSAGTFCSGNDSRLSNTRTPTDGTVTNIKVASDAAIAGTKINPDFGAQNIITTGKSGFGVSSVRANVTQELNGAFAQNINSSASTTIDCSTGNYFTRTVNAATTFVASNVPTGVVYCCVLEITHTSGAITWFTNTQWPGNSAPSLLTGRTHLVAFITDDGGSRWRATSQANYIN